MPPLNALKIVKRTIAARPAKTMIGKNPVKVLKVVKSVPRVVFNWLIRLLFPVNVSIPTVKIWPIIVIPRKMTIPAMMIDTARLVRFCNTRSPPCPHNPNEQYIYTLKDKGF